MENEELMTVLIETNKKMSKPIDEIILNSILSIVISNPLEEDRGVSQEKIRSFILKYIEV